MKTQRELRKDLLKAQSIVTQNKYNLNLLNRVKNFLKGANNA